MVSLRGRTRVGRSVSAALAGLAVLASLFATRGAFAYNAADPSGDRMVITDRSTAADIQPRVWLLTFGGGSFPGKWLMTKIPDSNRNTWINTAAIGIDSGIDAVSFTSGTTQIQRVFYTTGGNLYMLPFDNDAQGTVKQLPSPTSGGVTFQMSGTDLGAVTFLDGSSRRIAVASGASLSGNIGYICVWESGDLGSTWVSACSTDRPMWQSSPLNHDVVGVVARTSTAAEFYFRDVFGGLSRIRRTGTNAWSAHETITVPQGIGPSIVATDSQTQGQVELAIVGATSNLTYTTSMTPATTAPTWTSHPALPNSKTPSATPNALGSIWYHGTDFSGNPYTRTVLYVLGNDLGLYELDTTNDTGTWSTTWGGPFFSPTGFVGSVGAVTTTTGDPLRVPRLFGTVGYPTFTLQEFYNLYGVWSFRDHVKYQSDPIGVGDSGIAVAETSGAADTNLGIQTGIDRAFPNPWKIRLRSSTDGANTFDASDSVITPFTSGAYISDPGADSAGGVLHHSSLETFFGNGCHAAATGGNIVYRRGTSASAIAALHTAGTNSYLVETTAKDALDHPWTVTTTDASGTTAHLAYYVSDTVSKCGTTDGICYWKLAPGNVQSGPTSIAPFAGNGQPSRLIKGAGNEVYLYGDALGWSKICTLKNAFASGGVTSADCTTMGGGQSPSPALPEGGYVSVGPALSSWPESGVVCPLINGQKYACFSTWGLQAAAADPTVKYKVHVAYVVTTNNTNSPPTTTASTIYYTRSAGGSSWGAWTVPVAITPKSGIYYDPAISVDSEGTIILSYSLITPVQTSTSGAATVYVTMSTDGGATWSTPIAFRSWNTSKIEYHCGRESYFIGDFRDAKAYGNRSRFDYQFGGSTTGAYSYYGHWLSRWTLDN